MSRACEICEDGGDSGYVCPKCLDDPANQDWVAARERPSDAPAGAAVQWASSGPSTTRLQRAVVDCAARNPGISLRSLAAIVGVNHSYAGRILARVYPRRVRIGIRTLMPPSQRRLVDAAWREWLDRGLPGRTERYANVGPSTPRRCGEPRRSAVPVPGWFVHYELGYGSRGESCDCSPGRYCDLSKTTERLGDPRLARAHARTRLS